MNESGLESLRHELDGIDNEISALIGRRFDVCVQIGHFKRKTGLPTMQPQRVAAVISRVRELANKNGFDPNVAEKIYELIIEEACRLEEAIDDSGSHS